jgi:hypothetical protein
VQVPFELEGMIALLMARIDATKPDLDTPLGELNAYTQL